ncbi:regulator [Vibrio diazotrophicus]|uniref:regulator n=1 Tax=Vibrio diazotrophicus TaxID=685 RepID=UPI00142DE9BF|nr:regulator [Vibrio diazotrophicus]NIY94259.1 regulator [Vibrio diazotrophicus]
MHKNRLFREFECGLSVEETAELCFKSARTVTEWDRGHMIPPECKRLMRFVKCRQISHHEPWQQFKMVRDKLELPTGQLVSPQQIVIGIALLEIQSELELKTTRKLIRFARVLAKMLNNSKAPK